MANQSTPEFEVAVGLLNNNFPFGSTKRDAVVKEYTRLRAGTHYHTASLYEAIYKISPELRPSPLKAGAEEYEEILAGEEAWVSTLKNSGS